MRRLLLAATALLVLGYGNLVAAEGTGQDNREKQMEKLGSLRARVMLKLNDMQKLVDNNQNGGMAAYNTITRLQTKTSQTIAKLTQEETAKPQEMRNQAVLDNLNKKAQRLGEMWTDFVQKDWPVFNEKMADPYQVFQSLNAVFGNVANIEMPWLKANLDFELLIGALTAIDRRVDEIKIQANDVVAEINKVVAAWEAFCKE
jgi:hypothetical protein